MSCAAGPTAVTNGLVLEYDMNNIQKSWKGKPSTNLILFSEEFSSSWDGQLFNNWPSSIVSTNVGTAPDGTQTADRLTGYYGRFNTSIAASVSTTYTFSVWLKNYSLVNSIYLHMAFGLNGALVNYNNIDTFAVTTLANWTRCSITFTSPASGINQIQYGIEFGASKASVTGPYAVDAWGAQLEVGSFATPYIPTYGTSASRSNTQAIMDPVNNNTFTANSLTYAANNTFSFNGSTDYITVPSLANYNFGSNITVEVIHKNTGGGYRGVVSNEYTIGTGFDLRYGAENYLGGAGNGTTLYCQVHTSVANYGALINAELNVWGHYAYTYNGSNIYAYKNGVLFSSIAATGTLGTNTNPVTIGRNSNGIEYLSGSLQLVKIYNRALSASEVAQNFNAMRSRYGL